MFDLLDTICKNSNHHAKWLNTLSYLENCGARKLAACEHPTKVKEEMLQHAAEEFRHAHYLKSQMSRVASAEFPDYRISFLLGGYKTLHYLDQLEIEISRYLKKELLFSNSFLKKVGYLLVTYAIEVRALDLYKTYDTLLKKIQSPVRVRSILLEEIHHLEEICEELNEIPNSDKLKNRVCQIEKKLYRPWIEKIQIDIT